MKQKTKSIKNEKKISASDVLKWNGLKFPISIYDYHVFRFMFGKDLLCKEFADDGEVIGTIHDEERKQ